MSDEQHILQVSTRRAWVTLVNSDLTEGRGSLVPKAVCELEATAIRQASHASTQGSDGEVREVELFLVGGLWYGPILMMQATDEDRRYQERLDRARVAREKAMAAGLTQEDLAAIVSGANTTHVDGQKK